MLLIISLLGSKKNFFVENEWEKKQEKNEMEICKQGTFF